MRAWKQRIKRTATNLLSLPPDTLLGSSRVSCMDGKVVIVENVHVLERVDECEIVLSMGKYRLRIRGEQFEVVLVTEREVHISGVVHNIDYLQNGG